MTGRRLVGMLHALLNDVLVQNPDSPRSTGYDNTYT